MHEILQKVLTFLTVLEARVRFGTCSSFLDGCMQIRCFLYDFMTFPSLFTAEPMLDRVLQPEERWRKQTSASVHLWCQTFYWASITNALFETIAFG